MTDLNSAAPAIALAHSNSSYSDVTDGSKPWLSGERSRKCTVTDASSHTLGSFWREQANCCLEITDPKRFEQLNESVWLQPCAFCDRRNYALSTLCCSCARLVWAVGCPACYVNGKLQFACEQCFDSAPTLDKSTAAAAAAGVTAFAAAANEPTNLQTASAGPSTMLAATGIHDSFAAEHKAQTAAPLAISSAADASKDDTPAAATVDLSHVDSSFLTRSLPIRGFTWDASSGQCVRQATPSSAL